MLGSRVLEMSTANKPEVYRNYTNEGNGNSMDVNGRLYTCEKDGRRVTRMEKDGKFTVIANSFEG